MNAPEPFVAPPRSFLGLGDGSDDDVWTALAAWRTEGRRFVLLTVVESRGFTPRKPGTHMLLDGSGATAGTIGGGAIEHDMLGEARALLASGGVARTVRKHLTQELGMCCGGEMVVHLEVLEARPRLWLFGAGYLAKPIAALAAGCGFDVRVVDGREDWAVVARFPGARVVCGDPEATARALDATSSDFAVVVTHDHALDQRLVQVLLAKPLRFLGMIGSLAKQRKFALRLRARGFGAADIARLRTPLGLAIGARTPEEIAVSVVAELVAVRRGGEPERGWAPRHPMRERMHAMTSEAATAPRPQAVLP